MKNLLILFVLALPSMCALGDVWTDCTAWFIGANDANSSGHYDTGELFDIRHIADTTQSGTREASARDNISILTEDVSCPILGRTLANQKVLYFDGSCTVTNEPSAAAESEKDIRVYGNCIKFADPVTNDSYTALIRFKPDEHHPWHSSYQNILNMGLSGGEKQGIMIGFPNTPGENWLSFCYGNQNYHNILGSNIRLTNSVYKCRSDVWHDLALIVSRPDGNTIRIRVGHAMPNKVPELDNKDESKMQWAQRDFKISDGNFVQSVPCANRTRLGGESGDSGGYGKTHYRGKVHMLAFWNRPLSDKEVIDAFGTPNPALIQVGVSGAAGEDLFKGTDNADVTISTQPEDWQLVPAKLTQGRKLTVNFSVQNWQTNANQVLRFAPSAGAGTISVAIDGTVVDGNVPVKAGATACVGIRGRFLKTEGPHTCTIVRTDAAAVDLVPGFIALSGSWQISPHDGKHTGMNSAGATTEDYYVTDGNFQHMRRVILPARYPVNIHFDIPPEFAGYRAKLVWATTASASGHKSLIKLNGLEIYDEPVVDGVVHTLKLPAGSLASGENILRWEDSSTESNYYSFDFIRFEIVSPTGLFVVIR